MADAPKRRVDGGTAAVEPPTRVLTPDEELRLLQLHAELTGDLVAAARLQTAYDPLEQTQENPELPDLLRAHEALAPARRRRGRRLRLRIVRRIVSALLLLGGVLLVVVSLVSRPA